MRRSLDLGLEDRGRRRVDLVSDLGGEVHGKRRVLDRRDDLGRVGRLPCGELLRGLGGVGLRGLERPDRACQRVAEALAAGLGARRPGARADAADAPLAGPERADAYRGNDHLRIWRVSEYICFEVSIAVTSAW